eukprot:875745-Rhodomonas_salina.2
MLKAAPHSRLHRVHSRAELYTRRTPARKKTWKKTTSATSPSSGALSPSSSPSRNDARAFSSDFLISSQ